MGGAPMGCLFGCGFVQLLAHVHLTIALAMSVGIACFVTMLQLLHRKD